jgi:hypothetical protein
MVYVWIGESERLMYMRGTSTQTGKVESIDYILKNIPKDATILDVGFGAGTYGSLLRTAGYEHIDGVDIYEEHIFGMGLDLIYDNIYIIDIMAFEFDHYDLVILGDVLEHLTLEAAKELVNKYTSEKVNNLLVSVPFMLQQEQIGDNPHEVHLQPDITEEYMAEHFPMLDLLYVGEFVEDPKYEIGVYVWRKE